MNHVGTQKLETERLTLRRFTVEDAEGMFYGWANDPESCRFLSWEPHVDVDATRELLTGWAAAYENPETYNWIIILKGTEKAVGNISVVELHNRHQYAEIGYGIGPKYWNRGLATEALQAVIRFLFETVEVHRIEARHVTGNPASGRVMEKAGMTLEGELRDCYKMKDGTFYNTRIYSILRDEWNRIHNLNS